MGLPEGTPEGEPVGVDCCWARERGREPVDGEPVDGEADCCLFVCPFPEF